MIAVLIPLSVVRLSVENKRGILLRTHESSARKIKAESSEFPTEKSLHPSIIQNHNDMESTQLVCT